MLEFKRGEFAAVSPKLNNPIKSGEKTLFYAYAPPLETTGLREKVVVAKPTDNDQIIIGPLEAVATIAQAFNVLDSVFPGGDQRYIDIVVSVRWDDESKTYSTPSDLKEVEKLSSLFGLVDNIKGTVHVDTLYNVMARDKYGVIPDVRRPLFLCPDYTGLCPRISTDALVLFTASVLRHEQAHVIMQRQGISPLTSLWEERQAMSSQAEFLLRMLQSGRFRKETDSYLIANLIKLSREIYQYRNGVENLSHFNPHRDGNLTSDKFTFKDDFAFGY